MPAATGVVHVYNTTNQRITLVLNGDPLPALDPAGGAASRYAPASLIVPRSNANRIPEAVFAETNTLSVMFQGILNTYKIGLDFKLFPSNNDLVLYVFYNYIVFCDSATNAIISSLAPS